MKYNKITEVEGLVSIKNGDTFKLEKGISCSIDITDSENNASILVEEEVFDDYFIKSNETVIAIKDIEIPMKYYRGNEMYSILGEDIEDYGINTVSRGRFNGITVLKLIDYHGIHKDWN